MERKLFLTIVIAACAFVFGCAGCSCGHNADSGDEEAVTENAEASRLGFNPDTLAVETGKVRTGDNFSGWVMRLGMSTGDAYALSMACDTIFDVKKLRGGNDWQAYYSFDADSVKTLEYIVYKRDNLTDVVFRCKEPFSVTVSEKPVETFLRYAEVTINSSLWADMTHAGITPLLILKLSDIYAWTIDFFALQKGDSFRVCYDEQVCEGKIIAVDTVRYASFAHNNDEFKVIMFDQGDGGNIYWNEKGESVRKAFLKAPLNYSRISSGYSNARVNPVTRVVQAHTGVDYAAPLGTPVVAIGDGTVISAKNEGAGGNVIRIKHNSVYTTAYLHLSKYATGIKAGARVHQGEVIGYVGSTGRSTGPHLDFRVWKNGSPINPLTMESPPTEPVREENMAAFLHTADSLALVADKLAGLETVETQRDFTIQFP